MPENLVTLLTSDGVQIPVDMAVAKMSLKVKSILENNTHGTDANNHPLIQLPNVRSHSLEKVLEWADYATSNPEGLGEEDDISAWEVAFLDALDNVELFDLIKTADHLVFPRLVEIGAKTVAAAISGATPEEIRDMFGIESDFDGGEDDMNENEELMYAEAVMDNLLDIFRNNL